MAGRILWIDDNTEQIREQVETLRDEGYTVVEATTASEGVSLLTEDPMRFLAVIIEPQLYAESILVPGPNGPEELETRDGFRTGLVLGRWIKRQYPFINVIGVSTNSNLHTPQAEWFKKQGEGYFDKYTLYISIRPLLLLLTSLAATQPPPFVLRTYILHGHDDKAKDELRGFLTTVLRIPNPIVLHDLPDQGRATLMARRDESNEFSLVLVLLPASDSPAAQYGNEGRHKNPANLIFEAGFWAALCQGNRGKILILHQGETDLPDDLPNVTLIDMGKGLGKAAEEIRRQVNPYLPLLRKAGP